MEDQVSRDQRRQAWSSLGYQFGHNESSADKLRLYSHDLAVRVSGQGAWRVLARADDLGAQVDRLFS